MRTREITMHPFQVHGHFKHPHERVIVGLGGRRYRGRRGRLICICIKALASPTCRKPWSASRTTLGERLSELLLDL